jgi:hypothetical protein
MGWEAATHPPCFGGPGLSGKSPRRAGESVTVVAVALGARLTIMVAHPGPGVALDCLDRH